MIRFILRQEPVLVAAVVGLVASLAAKYGLDLTPAQLQAVESAIAVLVAFVTRSLVTPVRK
jgi:uncharacterized protein (DUF697 family)